MGGSDSFIDDEDDTCPLCIEEFDLSDRSFKPCPCGYQVCQFCFNNINSNMNGLCPACRRPYDEKTIEWKVVTPEEVAEFKANIQKNQKKRAQEQRVEEARQRQAEKNDRKNLVGVRVVQKNLVYVTGLTPTVREDELMKTLRKLEFFGQYGNIQKISISNRKGIDGHNQSLGIYVTFEKKEDATRCIQAVNGSQNGDRVLRAQLGTTKYCSAWLRHETCQNRQCMFLHEQGDEEDSYSRQDLSSMNSIDSQRKQATAGGSRSASRQQGLIQQAGQASQPMARSSSKDGSDNGDGSALPSSANWARNPQTSRRGSHATSGATDSPAISSSFPVPAESAFGATQGSSAKDSVPQKRVSSSSQPKPTQTTESNKPLMDPIIAEILRNIRHVKLKEFSEDEISQYPPLFDINGGAKRRAMREAEKAESDPEEPADTQEASDGEPEAGGSLALGGEPEDSDPVRDFEQRRAPGAQPPIQKSIGEGIFGGSSVGNFGAAPGSSALGTIGNRTTTPHQQQPQMYGSVRPAGAGGFENTPPPGMGGGQGGGGAGGSQTSLFQQGHQRGSSRYNFANDGGASANSVKVAANPRVMAQQASMMPQQMHSQHGSQYYGSSMPGPPPGLKSTGTPPNPFSFSSGSGLVTKDSDMLHNMMRRGGAGGNAHEKREFVSSPFSNQYPPSTSSTPAPASGLLASLYGTPPGQFQDFGHKQKKKGKKHRHANTSSSGGSGLVDLADPSILQARMQHQQQSNAGVGQGPFGGQSQDDELPSLDEARSSVYALVADDDEPPLKDLPPLSSILRSSTPPIPLSGLGPRAPPGLGPPVGPISPAVSKDPVVPSPAISKAGPSTDTKLVSTIKPNIETQPVGKPSFNSVQGKGILSEEEFPALRSVRPVPSDAKVATPVTTVKQPVTVGSGSRKASSITLPSQAPIQPPLSSKGEKRATPGILNIATASKASHPKILDSSATTEKPLTDQVPTSSPVTRAGPKTLKIVPMPKTESPPQLPMATVAATVPAVRSVAASSHRPETPASELISDSASIISGTVSTSRPGSPPLLRSNSGYARPTTKSTKRKQRKESQKEFVDQIAAAPKVEREEIQPIIGRKKKQKKQKAPKPSAASRPETPNTQPDSRDELAQVPDDKPAPSTPSESRASQILKAPAKGPAQSDAKSKAKDQASRKNTGLEQPTATQKKDEKPPISPALILNELIDSSMLLEADKMSMLRPYPGTNWRHEPLTNSELLTSKPTYHKSIISDEDQELLLAGKPVRKIVDGSRTLLTPNGDCVRNLTEEEEDKYLELQQRVAETNATPAAFVSSCYEPGSGFALVKGRAVPNGPPGYFPQAPNAHPSDPVNKIQRDEAISYINQFVLPRIGLGTPSGEPRLGLGDIKDGSEADAALLSRLLLGGHHVPPTAGLSNLATHVSPRASDDVEERTRRVSGSANGSAGACSGVHGHQGNSNLPVTPLMSLEDAEAAMMLARKETEKLEKSLNQVIRRNRRLLLGSAH
ncbi:RNA recognition domain-containing protein [Zalerion maritima]|uniref:RNA recognition domain-containing protein n=1 Tax=Zalerion maritima TaxID=339359 RepID=A0AAD5RNM6_9PEZI|nr:RNA recognition domain-containing protein [Zalerion maritima]